MDNDFFNKLPQQGMGQFLKAYDENGTRRQDIDIYYSFVGKVELPDE